MQSKNDSKREYNLILIDRIFGNSLFAQTQNGLCASILLIMRHLCTLKLEDVFPENICTKLTLYNNYNLYKDILFVDKNKINLWKEFSKDRVNRFLNNTYLIPHVFAGKQNDYDFELITLLMNTYVNLNFSIFDFNFKNFDCFLWWRKTDKEKEHNFFKKEYPDFNEALPFVSNYQTILQTDDVNIFLKAKKYKNLYISNILPFDDSSRGAHKRPELTYNKKDHIKSILSLCHYAARIKIFVGYPGCVSMYILFLRKTFKNTFIFCEKNKIIV